MFLWWIKVNFFLLKKKSEKHRLTEKIINHPQKKKKRLLIIIAPKFFSRRGIIIETANNKTNDRESIIISYWPASSNIIPIKTNGRNRPKKIFRKKEPTFTTIVSYAWVIHNLPTQLWDGNILYINRIQ